MRYAYNYVVRSIALWKEGNMPTAPERPADSVALTIAMGFLGEIDEFQPELWVGPCTDRRHCPLFAKEEWAKDKCMIDGCPRRTVAGILAKQAEGRGTDTPHG